MRPRKKTRRSGFRLDVALNGERVHLAGSGRYGVLSVGVIWIRRNPRNRPKTKTTEAWNREQCELLVGAVTRGKQEVWPKVLLQEGDEITIRVLGPGTADPPWDRFPTPKPLPRTPRG